MILEWAVHLDAGDAEEIGQEMIALAARDQGRAEAVTEKVVEEAGRALWESVLPAGRRKPSPKEANGNESQTPLLDHFQIDLLELARQGRLDAAPERGREFGAIAGVLARRRRNSALLMSDSGTDLYQLIQGLAHAMVLGQAPQPLAGKRLLRIDGLQAGVKYRGQLEERVRALVTETTLVGDVLLYFTVWATSSSWRNR